MVRNRAGIVVVLLCLNVAAEVVNPFRTVHMQVIVQTKACKTARNAPNMKCARKGIGVHAAASEIP